MEKFQIRELYPLCVSSDITSTSEYKQCVLLLNFLSKQEIIELIDKPILQLKKYSLINILKGSKSTKSDLVIMYEQFCTFKQKLNNSSMEMNIIEEKKENINTTNKFDRHSFKKVMHPIFIFCHQTEPFFLLVTY